MRFSAPAFDAHLAEVGQAMTWRQAVFCPCRDKAKTGGPESDCAACGGDGVVWGRPRAAHAGVVGAAAARRYAGHGTWEDGDVMLSVPAASPLWHAGENDRVTLAEGHMPFQVRLVRNGTEKLRGISVVAVERCFWKRPGDGQLVPASLPRVDPLTGAMSWPLPDAPDPGARFTLIGKKRPDYYLFNFLPVTRAHCAGQPLPKKFHLRRWDLWRASGRQ